MKFIITNLHRNISHRWILFMCIHHILTSNCLTIPICHHELTTVVMWKRFEFQLPLKIKMVAAVGFEPTTKGFSFLLIWTTLMSKASRPKIPIKSGREMIVSNKEKVNRDVGGVLKLIIVWLFKTSNNQYRWY